MQEVYQCCWQVYGSPRIHAELRDQGITSSRKRVARLMREQGLSACRRHRRTITTSHPNEKWTGDMTAIWTYEGWLYLAMVLDLFSRRVIGWAMAETQDEALIETTLSMALLDQQPSPGLLFHSGRMLLQPHSTALFSRLSQSGCL
jgi:putative transposase